MRKWFVFFIKTSVSLALLIYFFLSIERDALLSVVDQARLEYFFAALLVGILALILSAYKWQVLLGADGPMYGLGRLFRLYLIGTYFNNFLPTSIGGDGVRVYLLSEKHTQRAITVVSVLAERVTGLVALILFLVVGVLFGWGGLEENANALVLALCIGLLVFFFCLSLKAFRGFIGRFFPVFLPSLIGSDFFSGIKQTFSSGKTVWKVTWTSLAFQFLNIYIYVLLARALSVNIFFSDLLVVVPLVTLMTLIPFSLNGVGIRECGFVFFLSHLDVSRAEALSLSLLFYGIIGLLSIVGGVLFFIDRTKCPSGKSAGA